MSTLKTKPRGSKRILLTMLVAACLGSVAATPALADHGEDGWHHERGWETHRHVVYRHEERSVVVYHRAPVVVYRPAPAIEYLPPPPVVYAPPPVFAVPGLNIVIPINLH